MSDVPRDPSLLGILRALADHESVDWDSLESHRDEPGFRAIARELHVVNQISTFHRTLQESPDPTVASSLVGSSSGTDVEQVRIESALGRPPSWGPLTLLERVGRGSFADVFRAWDMRLDREVAVKLLRDRDTSAVAQVSSLIGEARLLAKVRHPNVVTVHGAERIDGHVGIWTEFIHGHTLAHLVRQQGPFSADEASAIGIDLCRALAAVHQAGLLHRDIKAQNVMREAGGRIVLMDLGAGKGRMSGAMALGGDLTGTPLYLAPEAWQGGEATPQTDIYSVGVLLYHLVTGAYPVSGTTLDEVREAHRARHRTLLRDTRADLPHAFVDVVERALAADPAARYESAGAFEAALKQAHSALAIIPAATGARAAARQRPAANVNLRRGAVWLAAIAALFAGAFLLDIGGARSRWRTPAPPAAALTQTAPSPIAAAPRPAEPSPPAPLPHKPAEPPPRTAPPSGPPDVPLPRAPSPSIAEPGAQSADRKIRVPMRFLGRPSRDARYFPYVDATGDLQIWELTGGRSRRALEKEAGHTLASPVMSPRGNRVAYALSTAAGGWELRVVNADGTWPNVIVPRQTGYKPVPLDWSRDEQNILCRLDQHDGTADLVLVPASGGEPRLLQTFGKRAPSNARLSPNGRFVVYRLRSDSQPPREDLFVVGIDGSPPRLLVAGGVETPYAYDRVPAWTPDGKSVLFMRESTTVRESQDVWMLSVAEGVPQGDPFPVLPNLGPPTAMGLTDDGALFYMLPSGSSEAYTASIDLTGDVVRGAPSRISATNIGRHRVPVWSPDGASIVFYTEQPNPVRGFNPIMTLTVRDLATGAERFLTPHGIRLDSYAMRWSTDARSVIVRAADLDSQRWGLFRVDVRTSETTIVVWTNQNPPLFECSPDGRDLFYVDTRGIVAHDLSGGDERVVVARGARSGVGRFGISPDGRAVAFVGRTRVQGSETVALEVQTIGGMPRELLRVTSPNELQFQLWTPDGQDILFSQWTGPITPSFALWRIGAKGGEPRDTHFAWSGSIGLGSLSPDGRRIAYTERELFWELWIKPMWRLR
jgi:Tol biopolymer transport system component